MLEGTEKKMLNEFLARISTKGHTGFSQSCKKNYCDAFISFKIALFCGFTLLSVEASSEKKKSQDHSENTEKMQNSHEHQPGVSVP